MTFERRVRAAGAGIDITQYVDDFNKTSSINENQNIRTLENNDVYLWKTKIDFWFDDKCAP